MYYGNNLDKPTGNLIIDLKRVTDLGAEPITVDEAKTQLRVTFMDDDIEITALITKARRYVENYCNISIVTQRIQVIASLVDAWELPYGPVITIESVQDNSGVSGSGPVTFNNTTSEWRYTAGLFGPSYGYQYKIVYTAGMTCPDDLKDAILQVITFLYENRGKVADVTDLQKVLTNADNYKRLLWI